MNVRWQVYAIGGLGQDVSVYLDTVELYDAQLNAWRELDLCATDPSCFKRAFFAAVARA